VTATTAEDENYASAASIATAFTIAKAMPSIAAAPTARAITYGQTLADSVLDGGSASVNGAQVPGRFAFTMPSTSPNVGTASQSVTFTPFDTTNYNTVTTSVSVTVSSEDGDGTGLSGNSGVGSNGSTYTNVGFQAGTENNIAANGLSNLMNYALGGTASNPSPDLPVLTSDANAIMLTANIRNDDSSLNLPGKVVGQWAESLEGNWIDIPASAVIGATSSVDKTTVKRITVLIEEDKPRKFLRFKVSK
jgi:hypothetical protein